ncbi:MAG: hypothetical protein K2N89_03575 [Lachnospiraceae bacterium]|nr:hypothetical protein [Lachnospiraceae bacterium]
MFTVDQGSPKTVFDCKVSFLDKKRRNAVTERYTVDWDKYETISCEDDNGGVEKLVTENAVKVSGRDEIMRTGQDETANDRGDECALDMDAPDENAAEYLSDQNVQNCTAPDEAGGQEMSQPVEPGDLTELFSVDNTEEDADENEELLQRYYEKLMKEEEQNRQFEAYEQDREQQLCHSSLFDSDADTGCFDLSIDGFGMTDD